MARFSLIALLTLALSGAAYALPPAEQELLGGQAHTAASWTYDNCGEHTDIVDLNSFTVSPDPPKIGKNLTITANGIVGKKIEEGAYANVIVKLGLIKLLSKTFDICEEARKANASVQCPVEPGDYTVSQTVELPSEIPRAKFTINVRGFSVDEEALLCLDLKVNFL